MRQVIRPSCARVRPASFQGSPDGVNWTTLRAGSTAGTVGESLTVNTTIAPLSIPSVVLQGDGFRVSASPVSRAISDAGPNDI